jgi:hypothetical protein
MRGVFGRELAFRCVRRKPAVFTLRIPGAGKAHLRDMKRILNYTAPLILGLAFVATLAATGCAVRYYDADHRDYHRWNGGEDRAYHGYWNDRHPREEYREYSRLNDGQRKDYWKWRHDHPDRDRR